MRRLSLILVTLSLSACHHNFPPPDENQEDAKTHDRDGAVDLVVPETRPDQYRRDFPISEAGRLDLAVPSECGDATAGPVVDATTPGPDAFTSDATSDECSSLVNWSCGECGVAFHRMVCTLNNEIKREIWCDDKECRCKRVGEEFPFPCLGVLKDGRTGCKRCVSAFLQGCCNPVFE